ncbi:hypothetical protein HK102_002250, partial [Quaeritorhiza haematococci]
VELAVTGRAFNVLLADGNMRRLLLETRVFARMLPEDKVRCVKLHMERAVTAMCGDGGNDAGALKAAHAGIALSEAESSVVSHFSSSDRSLNACVRLLREARCSLDLSFASYKYLIMYGEVLAFLGLLQYYFTVNMSQAVWILIDGSTVPLSWALTMAKPAKRLAPTRPTARLLGVETVISIVGQIIINIIFMVIVTAFLFSEPWFLCREFDGNTADVRRWWELADNFEASVTGLLGAFQIIHAAAAFNLGWRYRKGPHRNIVFLCIYTLIFSLLSYVTLADPNALGCLFHVNCGVREAVRERGYGYDILGGFPKEYHAAEGHNIMPVEFRWRLWVIYVVNLGVLMVFEGVVVLGPVRRWAAGRWPLRRLQVRK